MWLDLWDFFCWQAWMVGVDPMQEVDKLEMQVQAQQGVMYQLFMPVAIIIVWCELESFFQMV